MNGTEWLVVTKLDVLDELAEIPICTGYRIDGEFTDEIPADVAGLQKIEAVYTSLKGWRAKTEGITEFEKLPTGGAGVFAVLRSGRATRRSEWFPLGRTGNRRCFFRNLRRLSKAFAVRVEHR